MILTVSSAKMNPSTCSVFAFPIFAVDKKPSILSYSLIGTSECDRIKGKCPRLSVTGRLYKRYKNVRSQTTWKKQDQFKQRWGSSTEGTAFTLTLWSKTIETI